MARLNTFVLLLVAVIIQFIPLETANAADSLAVINKVVVDEKQNGIFIYAVTSQHVNKENLSGWITENNWAYITIYRAQTDTARVSKNYLNGPVKKIEASNTFESTQLAIQLRKPVKTIEYFTSVNPPSVSFTLGYPEGPVTVAAKLQRQDEESMETSPAGTRFMPWYGPLKRSMYLAGTVMTIAGVLSSDQSESGGGELAAGLGILGVTYLFDTYIMPRIQKDPDRDREK